MNQRISPQRAKANAKNVIGLVLHDALSNLAIRVTCGATIAGGNKYPITQLHMRCLCCNETVCIDTLGLLNGDDDADASSKTIASEANDELLFNKLTDFIINEYIKRHIFRSFESLSGDKNNPTVTNENKQPHFDEESTDDEEDVQIHIGPRFSLGCNQFDKHISINYPSIKVEIDATSNIDARKYGLRTTSLIQKILYAGRDIILYEGQKRFEFVNDAYIETTETLTSTTRTSSEQTASTISNNTNSNPSTKGRRRITTKRYEPPEQKKTTCKTSL